jgi:DNA-binding MarR family transcriptional regulator
MTAVDVVRSFNRVVTRRIGALDERFLGRHRSLGACRVLFEIGTEGIEIRTLRARLDLDSGYLSRLLRGLERDRLIRTTQSPGDGRVGCVILTAAGRRELAALNRRSDTAAGSILEFLTPKQQQELTTAMSAVERLPGVPMHAIVSSGTLRSWPRDSKAGSTRSSASPPTPAS